MDRSEKMKGLVLIITCMAVALSAKAESRQARLDSLKESFRFQPVASEPVSATESDDVVVLENLTVVESISRRALHEQITAKWVRDSADRFSWKKGGALLKSKKIDAGAWVSLEDREVGALPTREIKVKIELFRIKW
jgi:hypothetical protein